MTMNMELRVEYRYDPESDNWSFVVPGLGIVGAADTRTEAETRAIDAIAFTLEADRDDSSSSDAEVRYLHVTVER
jgi:hypothetical protein